MSLLLRNPDRRPSASLPLFRSGVFTYVFALALIAACSIVSHLLTDSMVRQQRVTAAVVNLTGRQRMLAQRVVRISLERAAGTTFRSPAENDRQLADAVARLEAGHRQIMELRHSTLPGLLNNPAVQAIYSGPAWHLDAQLAEFLGQVRSLERKPATQLTLNDPDLVRIELAVNGPLIDALNAAVSAVEATSEASLDHLRHVLLALTVTMLALLVLEALLLYRPLFKRLRQSTEELVRVGRTDPLTGCLNRRAFLQEAATVLRRERQAGRPVCVAMLDLDRFKAVNDRYGHPAGDSVINSVVATALRQVRSADLLCRMGGEEFAVLLPGSSLATAAIAAERLRNAVSQETIVLAPEELGLELHVTVSIGVAELCRDDETVFPLLARADRALYRAKQNGRDRVECEQAGSAAPVVQQEEMRVAH